jgi:hypothetical protein
VAAFNMTVDPFGLWELRRIDGINRYKPDFSDGMREQNRTWCGYASLR